MTTPVVSFKRGATFSILMKIPSSIPDSAMHDWTATAQMRKLGSDVPSGFIADMSCHWLDPNTNRILVVQHDLTDNWPICEAEFDVLFKSPKGQRMRSNTVQVTIKKGVTLNG